MINLFGSKTVKIEDYLKKGSLILDVRSKEEYAGGHIDSSLNIPLHVLDKNVSKLDTSKPIITCCASGMRSASAKKILKRNGFNQVLNGGSWMSLQKHL